MLRDQASADLDLQSRFVGGLPLVNRLLERLKVDALLDQALPGGGKITAARALGVLLRVLVLNDRQPVYGHLEWARQAEVALLGLKAGEAEGLNDGRIGRTLDRLFDADRAALMTEVVLRAVREFGIELDRLHNDSTTLTLTGTYRAADGRVVRGLPSLHVSYGHSKNVAAKDMWRRRRCGGDFRYDPFR